MRWFVVALACVVTYVGFGGAEATAGTRTFALVVANNRSLDPKIAHLDYADDDGARFYEMMSAVGDRVELLTRLDRESQRVFPRVVRHARRPIKRELLAAMSRLVGAMARAKHEGHRVVFYFYFAGHGEVGKGRQGYIHLEDTRFSRSELYRQVIAKSKADTNHIVIDACNSNFMVMRRSNKAQRKKAYRKAMGAFLKRESLRNYPNTGVILSTASAAESHEWSKYRSGIFSHQLLSALWGAADVNNNGEVDYLELKAYIHAANLRVRDPRARLKMRALAPRANRGAPVMRVGDLKRRAQARGVRPRVVAYLTIPKSFTGHYWLEDDRGIRYAEFNKTAEQPLVIALLARPEYHLISRDREAIFRPKGDRIDAGGLTFRKRSLRERGAIEESFRRDLYTVPFGRSFLAGYRAGQEAASRVTPRGGPEVIVRTGPRLKGASTWKWVTLSVGIVGLLAGTVSAISAAHEASVVETGNQSDAQAAEQRYQDALLLTAIGFGVGITGAVASAILFAADRPRAGSGPALRGVSFAPTRGGVSAFLRGSF